MTRITGIITLSFFLSLFEAFSSVTQEKPLTGKEVVMMKFLKTYSPESFIMLDECINAPLSYDGRKIYVSNSFSDWIKGSRMEDMALYANTVVHEMCHNYTGIIYLKLLKNAKKPVDGNYMSFYLDSKHTLLVKNTSVFKTSEIASLIPAELQGSRFKTYIIGSDNNEILGSQQYGCYGLLDEMNAYYWGTKASFDMYSYYQTKNNHKEGWMDYFQKIYGTYFAYLEFKNYILNYLIYAQKNHPGIFHEIMSNTEFLNAFKKIDENWYQLLTDFKKVQDEFTIGKNGIKLTFEKDFTNFDLTGIGNFSEEYIKLSKELAKVKYREISLKLRIIYNKVPALF